MERVLAGATGSVLVLTLNGPERLNAWNGHPLKGRYFERLDDARIDRRLARSWSAARAGVLRWRWKMGDTLR